MNDLNFMEKLLDGVEVEWKILDDIAEIYLGLTYTPTYVSNGIKFISAKNTSNDFLDLRDVKYISEEEYLKSTSNAKPKRGDVLFTRVGSNLGHPVIVDTEEELCIFVSLGFIRVNPKKVLNSYIKHWMKTDLFWEQVRKNVHGSAKVNLNTGWLKKFEIAIPPLPVQSEIVRILDNFTELTTDLTADLTAELTARKKQYTYYRDKLLTFEDGEVEFKLLGEISTKIFSGKNKIREDEGIYPIFGSTGIIGRTNNKVFDDKQILVARVGANAGYVHIAEGSYDVSDNTLIIQIKENISMKYLYYLLVNMNLNQFARGAGQPLITAGQLKLFQIPIPPLKEQERIVNILDKFDTLTNSIKEGLPKEIKLRQQQYEYYRDLLLTFPKPAEVL